MSSRSTGGSSDVQLKIDSMKREFARLEEQAELTTIQDSINRIKERIAEIPGELNGLRRRGFVHSRELEERFRTQQGQWRNIAPKVETALKAHKSRLKASSSSTSRLVARARPGQAPAVSSAESAVNSLSQKIAASEKELRAQYSNVDSDLSAIDADLRKIKWMLDALEESEEIKLRSSEGPLMAVKSEWHRDGDDGPEGVLFLTDQRLLFEQREEIVTKKRFGVFKSESEIVQKLWLDINVSDIDKVEDSEKGGFLGMGKADMLDLVCTANAPGSRALFHNKGQDSADWRSLIRRAQSGEVAAERHAQAKATPALKFPSSCPNCMADLPEAARGATRVKCDFCGSVVSPLEA
jgi:uncharacterized protein YukE